MTSVWEEVCNLVIRPQRCIYDSNVMLGPRLFMLGNKIFERKDFEIKNKRNFKIKCSHYMPIESQRKSEKLPCVVYLHGNCGSRCDAIDTVQLLLPYDITVFSFDFAGSGLSEGDFVSLGYFEQHDVVCVINHLRKEGRTSKIGLWGRSMGAATALIVSNVVGDKVSGIVCDSPFSSLENVIIDLVKKYGKVVPKRFTKIGVKMMKRSIMSRAGFDIYHNNPIRYCQNTDTPALFGAAFDDNFIQMSQSEKIYEEYCGEKTFVRFDGDHNSERPDFFYESVSIFFYNVLISNDRQLKFDDPQKKKKREKQKRKLKKEKQREKLRERARERAKRELESFELSDEDNDYNSSGDHDDAGRIENAIQRVRKHKKIKRNNSNRNDNNNQKSGESSPPTTPVSPTTRERTVSSPVNSAKRVRKHSGNSFTTRRRNNSASGMRKQLGSSDEEDSEDSEGILDSDDDSNEDDDNKGGGGGGLMIVDRHSEDIRVLESSSFREKNKQQIVVPKSLNENRKLDVESSLINSQGGVDSDEEEGEDDDDDDINSFSEDRRKEMEKNLAFKNF